MASQKIRIKLKAYDHRLIDQSTDKIIKTAKIDLNIVSPKIIKKINWNC